MKLNRKISNRFSLIFISFLCTLSFFSIFLFSKSIRAENQAISGYAWSPNIGWIDMTGVFIDSENGDFSGYAWSPNIGWISFNGGDDIAGCKNETNPNVLDGNVRGTARALNAIPSTSDSEYSGCIDLSDLFLERSGDIEGQFSNWAWGEGVIGWIDFSGVFVNIFDEEKLPSSVVLYISEGSNPIPATDDQELVLGWNGSRVNSCDIAGFGINDGRPTIRPISGIQEVTIPSSVQSKVFSIKCLGENGTASDSLSVWRQGAVEPKDPFDGKPRFEEF